MRATCATRATRRLAGPPRTRSATTTSTTACRRAAARLAAGPARPRPVRRAPAPAEPAEQDPLVVDVLAASEDPAARDDDRQAVRDARRGARVPLARGQAVLVGALRPAAVRPGGVDRRARDPRSTGPRGGRGLGHRPRPAEYARTLRLRGRLEPGSDLRAGAKASALYDPPPPTRRRRAPATRLDRQHRGPRRRAPSRRRAPLGDVTSCWSGAAAHGTAPDPHLPMALVPHRAPARRVSPRPSTLVGQAAAGLPALPPRRARPAAARPAAHRSLALPRPDDARSTRDHRRRPARPGRLLPGGPGAARHRQDLHRRARHRRARRAGLEGRRRRPVARRGGEPARRRDHAGLPPERIGKKPRRETRRRALGVDASGQHAAAFHARSRAGSWSAAPRGTSPAASASPTRARPAGRRRGGAVLARQHPRGVHGRPQPAPAR